MMKFTSDFFAQHIANWERWLAEFKGRHARGLEIGSYEGRSASWLLENVLTHPSARLYCIDTFKGGQDLPERTDLFEMFKANIQSLPAPSVNVPPWDKIKPVPPWNKVKPMVGPSAQMLAILLCEGRYKYFDFAYIDGSHYAADVMFDAALTWPTLKPGALLIFDDYEWAVDPEITRRPKLGIDAFMDGYSGKFEVVAKGWQVVLRKI